MEVTFSAVSRTLIFSLVWWLLPNLTSLSLLRQFLCFAYDICWEFRPLGFPVHYLSCPVVCWKTNAYRVKFPSFRVFFFVHLYLLAAFSSSVLPCLRRISPTQSMSVCPRWAVLVEEMSVFRTYFSGARKGFFSLSKWSMCETFISPSLPSLISARVHALTMNIQFFFTFSTMLISWTYDHETGRDASLKLCPLFLSAIDLFVV